MRLHQRHLCIVEFNHGGFADFIHLFGNVVTLLRYLYSGVGGLVVLDAQCHLVVKVADGDAQVAFGILALQGEHVARHLGLLDGVVFLETVENGDAEADCRR